MNLRSTLLLTLALTVGASAAFAASTVTYTCDASIDATAAGTCNYLQTNIASLYTSTFNNIDASIYIEETSPTGLGSSSQYYNYVTYSQYKNALVSTASSDAVDTSVLANLGLDTTAYGSKNVEITGALGTTLGFSSLTGTTAGGSSCTLGTLGCYDGVIDIVTPAGLSAETSGSQSIYWDQLGGSIGSTQYDFYSIVQHETDEILGTSSCISTQSSLTDGCGSGVPSAVDLFRYSSSGTLVLLNSTPGAYFSYNGGATDGAGAGVYYNTIANGDDYADFINNCAQVQDAEGCLGAAQNINTDGKAEINILDAVGYNTTAPEPGTWFMLATGLAGVAAIRRRRA